MVLSSLFFLDLKGKILISRDYRGDISARHAEEFIELLAERELELDTSTGNDGAGGICNVQPPIFHKDGISYCYIKHNNLYLLALTRRNSNVMVILQFLHRLIQVFKEYFFELEEESLRDNFVIIYELLDEMMDFGYPQLTETKILKEYITQQSFKLEKSSKTQLSASDQLASKASQASTSVVSWRPEGIKYRKNEVFLDVVESVNLSVNAHGQVIKNEVMGSVKIRCYLSGMPELKLGLNDKILFDVRGNSFASGNNSEQLASSHSASQSSAKAVELEHVKFHQCVKLARFEQDRTIAFIPPDGDFELLSYRVSPSSSSTSDASSSGGGGGGDMKPLFWVDCKVEKFTQSTLEYLVTVRSQYKRRTAANNVTILVPVPAESDTPRLKASLGTAQYAPEVDSIRWTIGFFPGNKEFSLKVKVGLPSLSSESVQATTLNRPISLLFEIPYYTMSGIQVRYLKIVEKSGYPALPWVRYITQNGIYEFKMPSDQDTPEFCMFLFVLFSVLYPLNLYVFQSILPRKHKENHISILYAKVLSILVSCVLIYAFSPFEFNFTASWSILGWTLLGVAPFILPICMASPQTISDSESLNHQVRDYLIAPACEEFYYRMVLPMHCGSMLASSLAFSFAHAHPLFIKSRRESEGSIILAQCAISFSFGLVANGLKLRMWPENSIFVWAGLTLIHALANYCGVPLLVSPKNHPICFYIQVIIIMASLYSIVFFKN